MNWWSSRSDPGKESWPHMMLGLVVLAGTIWLLVVLAGVTVDWTAVLIGVVLVGVEG